MKKYLYLIPEYLLLILSFSIFSFLIMILQFGTKALAVNFDLIAYHFFSDYFIVIQIIIPAFCISLLYKTANEVIREKNIILTVIEKLIVMWIMMTVIRVISIYTYSLVVYHNLECRDILMRFILCDITNTLLLFAFAKLVQNKYVALTLYVMVTTLFFILKWLNHSLFIITMDGFVDVGFVYYISIVVGLILVIVSNCIKFDQ